MPGRKDEGGTPAAQSSEARAAMGLPAADSTLPSLRSTSSSTSSSPSSAVATGSGATVPASGSPSRGEATPGNPKGDAREEREAQRSGGPRKAAGGGPDGRDRVPGFVYAAFTVVDAFVVVAGLVVLLVVVASLVVLVMLVLEGLVFVPVRKGLAILRDLRKAAGGFMHPRALASPDPSLRESEGSLESGRLQQNPSAEPQRPPSGPPRRPPVAPPG